MRDGVAQLATDLGRDILRARLLGAAAPMVAGRYRVDRILGRGASGVVVEAVDTAVGLPRALKMAPVGSATAGAYDEARTLMQLEDAANVVRVYHVDRAPLVTVSFQTPVDFVTMKLVRGPTLRTWMATTRPSAIDALEKFIDVAQGLVASHALGIVHGDVKTDNVMIDEGGRALLLDFGFAAQVRSGQAGVPRSVAAGTGPYLAPEVLRGTVRRRSDVYSFAVSLWEAWTGALPFAGEKPEFRWFGGPKHLQGAHLMPALLQYTLVSCLHSDPGLRPNMAQVLQHLKLVEDELVVAELPPIRRSWRLRFAVLAVFVAAPIYFVPMLRWRLEYTLRDKLGLEDKVTLRVQSRHVDPSASSIVIDRCNLPSQSVLQFRRFGHVARLTAVRPDGGVLADVSDTDVDWSWDRVQLAFGREGCELHVDVPISSSTQDAPLGTFSAYSVDDAGRPARQLSGNVTFEEDY